MKIRIAAAFALLLAGGCDQQPELVANVSAPARPPEQVCGQARQAIEKLASDAGVQSDGKGGATIMESAWLEMGEGSREQVIQLVGFDAACRSEQPSGEQNVTIRSEYGRVMVQQVVETSNPLTRL